LHAPDHHPARQQQLADQAGCTRQTIILLEQRRYVPSLALAFRIANTFGKSVDEVFEYVGKEEGK